MMTKHLYGLIGENIAYSLSPCIHKGAFLELKIAADYRLLSIPKNEFVPRLKHLKEQSPWQGFNVTVPYKEKILSFVDHLDPIAKSLGAVNTIMKKGKAWWGYNTDVYGFITPIQEKIPGIKRALLIGAGGAARAVLYALGRYFHLSQLVIANRSLQRAQYMAQDLASLAPPITVVSLEDAQQIVGEMELIVNATPAGSHLLAGQSPINLPANIKKNTLVYDLIYRPWQTPLLQKAQQMGAATINGWPMLVYQAARSFEIWTEQPFPQQWLKNLLTGRACL